MTRSCRASRTRGRSRPVRSIADPRSSRGARARSLNATMGFAGALVVFDGRAVTEDVSTLFRLISRMRIRVHFAVSHVFALHGWGSGMKIPKELPVGGSPQLFGSGTIGRWPAHALVIVARIPVPLRILCRFSATYQGRPGPRS